MAMQTVFNPSPYSFSITKRLFDLFTSLSALITLFPLLGIIALLIKIGSKGPPFFRQMRIGKDAKVFTLIKFRTMQLGSERRQKVYKHLNEADGPVFKIYNDPRLTPFGKFLAHTGLDELPQLINVLKGDISLVGPRPLPVYEAKKLTKHQKIRELVKPGITSSWITSGAHNLTFGQWTKLDREYVQNASLLMDLEILGKTLLIVLRQTLNHLQRAF